MDASILDSALSHTRRSDVSEKEIDDNDQLNMNGLVVIVKVRVGKFCSHA